MNSLLNPSIILCLAAILLIGYTIGIKKKHKITTIIISRLFLLLGTVIFADDFIIGDYQNVNIIESGAIYFELGLATLLIAPFLLTSRKKKNIMESK
ncbi:hypothetical protein [Bacillus massiliigorillae]|uniref:hypothetical protein n=1 Tax=Bacillus massiliigorillae TaxID=1243664 RepID=UPI00039F2A19|nr:hypothetical protein [Bacillus massiliigorillae]